jgi:NDP-sugar pyrophosphorylase family protein
LKPTLVILAAGLGSRYGGIKQMDPVGINGETLLDFSTFDAKRSSFGKVVYIIRKDIEGDFRERIFDSVAQSFDAQYVFQTLDAFLTPPQKRLAAGRVKPWGTVHAVLCAKNAVKEPFVVINADDYYGRTAFQTLAAYLWPLDAASAEHAMVGYVLENTMSKAGSVTRGVCTVKDGSLVSMKENTNICYEGDKIVSLMGDQKTAFTGKEWVSMNFFGFAPTIFAEFAKYFENFIDQNAGSENAEALLPTAVNEMVASRRGKLKFFTSQEQWFGMTYPEDRALVKEEIAKKIASGYYPQRLWVQ